MQVKSFNGRSAVSFCLRTNAADIFRGCIVFGRHAHHWNFDFLRRSQEFPTEQGTPVPVQRSGRSEARLPGQL